MKKLLVLVLILLVLTTVFVGCDSKTESPTEPTESNESPSAQIQYDLTDVASANTVNVLG